MDSWGWIACCGMLRELETLGMRSMVGTVFETTKSRKIQRWMDGNIARYGSEKVDEVSSRVAIGVKVARGASLVRKLDSSPLWSFEASVGYM